MLSSRHKRGEQNDNVPVRRESLDVKVPTGTQLLVKRKSKWLNAISLGVQKDPEGQVQGVNVLATVDNPRDPKAVFQLCVAEMGRKCLMGHYQMPYVFEQASVRHMNRTNCADVPKTLFDFFNDAEHQTASGTSVYGWIR